MDHTVTAEDVKRIYTEEQSTVVMVDKARGTVLKTPAEAFHGTRTRVHELLQNQLPLPYQLPPPSRVFHNGEWEERDADTAARKVALAKSIPDELLIESEKARSQPNGQHQDAVHYVQKKHGIALWEETDRLVSATLGSAPGGGGGPVGLKLARKSLIEEAPPNFRLNADGTAAIDMGNPFEPLEKLAKKVWKTAREAMLEIGRALGGPFFSWSNAGESSLWTLVFQNTNFAQAPILQGSSTAGSFFIALHTANPGQTGTQATSEAAYTSYARVAVARSSGGWTLTGNNPIIAENAAAVTFPAATGGSETETYFSFGSLTSGAGVIYGYGALTSSLAVSSGITPSFAINALQCNFT